MKKLLLFLMIMLPSAQVFAVEGTCSWHGGVNCTAGPDWDGSPVCNDGWRDSSEFFYNTKACLVDQHICTQTEFDEIKTKYNLSAKEQNLEELYSKIAALNTSSSDSSALREVAIMAISLNSQYETAYRDYNFYYYQATKECYQLGNKNYLKELTKTTYSLLNQTQPLCSIKDSHPITNTQCACNTGLAFDGTACIPLINYCQKKLGASAMVVEDNCGCLPGLVIVDNSCVFPTKDEHLTETPQQSIQTESTPTTPQKKSPNTFPKASILDSKKNDSETLPMNPEKATSTALLEQEKMTVEKVVEVENKGVWSKVKSFLMRLLPW